MTKYVRLDENDYPAGYWDSEINKNIPSDAIQISDDVYNELISNRNRRKLVNGRPQEAPRKPLPIDQQNEILISGKVERLRSSSWIYTPDVQNLLTSQEKATWRVYRQLVINNKDPDAFPTEPDLPGFING